MGPFKQIVVKAGTLILNKALLKMEPFKQNATKDGTFFVQNVVKYGTL